MQRRLTYIRQRSVRRKPHLLAALLVFTIGGGFVGFPSIKVLAMTEIWELLPNGQHITPLAAEGAVFQPLNPGLPTRPDFTAGQAVATATSPDGNTLLVLTSGYNRNADPAGQ